ncbi:MAG: hypothetical protein KDA42_03265 [Planctomycetales bacterium]|nr:hypothetical protein [Planctomycetales bacterium]
MKNPFATVYETGRQRQKHLGFLAVGILSLGMFAGCGSGASSAETEGSSLKPLAVLYGRYIGQHRGQPPASEAEFKEFIRSFEPPALKSLGVHDVDQLFVSQRDGQPFVVLYGEKSKALGPAGAPIVAYEKQGIGGRRFVASESGAVEEMDEEQFRALVPNP